jgi:hypothetical protein
MVIDFCKTTQGADLTKPIVYDTIAVELAMNCDTIKYRIIQSPETKDLTLQIFRPYGDKDNQWMMVDHFNEITAKELICLRDYISSLLKKDK